MKIEVEVGARITGSKDFTTIHLAVFDPPLAEPALTNELIKLERNIRWALAKLAKTPAPDNHIPDGR